MKTYKTAELAKMVGVHPNTVRLYETIGFISVPKRSDNGYRCYTECQLFELKLARLALKAEILHKGLRKHAVSMIKTTATGNYEAALALSRSYREALIQVEQEAELAIKAVKQILSVQSDLPQISDCNGLSGYRRQEAAEILGVTIDTLRNWELNGLLDIPRHGNGYRYYTEAHLQRALIIRSLRHAGYSLMAILRLLKALDKDISVEICAVLDTPSEFEEIISVYDHLLSCLREAQADTNQIIGMLEAVMK